MLHRRHFTLEQADALRPAVGHIVRRLRQARARIVARGADADLPLRAETTGGAWPGRARAESALALTLGFERLGRLDVLVRDLDRGIVDFPSLIDGREAYLCWQVDEPEITHWHGLESGFAGRREISPDAHRRG
jgi:hypothetical protein